MKHYDQIIDALSNLPQASVAGRQEVLYLIKQHALMGSGIGYVDARLLASTKLTGEGRLLTRDKNAWRKSPRRLASVTSPSSLTYSDKPALHRPAGAPS